MMHTIGSFLYFSSSSALACYLNQDPVKQKLSLNIQSFFTENNALKKHYELNDISRCFSHLPQKPPFLFLLLESIQEALLYHEENVWIDFALALGIEELFDEHLNLREDIYDLFNLYHLLDILYPTQQNEVKSALLAGYIEMMAEPISDVVASMQYDGDELSSPGFLYSKLLNQKLKTIQVIDKELINTLDKNILSFVNNPHIRSLKLKKSISEYLDFKNAYKTLNQTLENPAHDFNLRKQGTLVLREIEKIRTQSPDEIKLIPLITVLGLTKTLIETPHPDLIKQYREEASQIEKHSWGGMLAGGMHSLARTATTITSSLFAAASYGFTAPVRLFGMRFTTPVRETLATGTVTSSIDGSGQSTLFKTAQKHSLKIAMEKLAEIAEKKLNIY